MIFLNLEIIKFPVKSLMTFGKELFTSNNIFLLSKVAVIEFGFIILNVCFYGYYHIIRILIFIY